MPESTHPSGQPQDPPEGLPAVRVALRIPNAKGPGHSILGTWPGDRIVWEVQHPALYPVALGGRITCAYSHEEARQLRDALTTLLEATEELTP